VQQVGDGVARVEGLSEAMLDEVVLFSKRHQGADFRLSVSHRGAFHTADR
jgi:F0F1-type ATP synthase alpha subunit